MFLSSSGVSGLTARCMTTKAKHSAVLDCTGKVEKGLDVLLNQKPDLGMIMVDTTHGGLSRRSVSTPR